ncbi:MAG: hypothetical protein AM325_014705 [Candidatus Thorarchaeota archaeon SMTZ1-45]|nr:MAG: hypothetical protein AM325_16115 [Candidatus Thorarchaeota archaeon SMTZ1-45]
MADSIITYKSITRIYAAILLGIFLFLIVGYYLADLFLPTSTWDWITILLVFVAVPVAATALGFYIGWYGKKSAIDYTNPTWTLEPVQMSIDDAKALVKRNQRRYWRMVSNSSYWTFFIPITLLLFMAGLPVYIFFESTNLVGLDSWMFAFALSLTYTVASIGALLATSNSASEDFDILLVREAIALAKAQSNVPGLSYVRIVFDKGELDGYEVYENPRVVSRILGIEKDAYIESWSEELHAVNRVLCRLHRFEDTPQVIWWWISTDRNFRKFIGEDEKGYYVRLPVESNVKHPGVKDISTIFENAVAIIILEWLSTRGENVRLSDILKQLNVVPPEG